MTTLEAIRAIMLSGQMYNDLSPVLVEARENTVFLTNQYNQSFGAPAEERTALLKRSILTGAILQRLRHMMRLDHISHS